MDFLLFLGRLHVVALHLPIGLVLAAVALDLAARRPQHRALAPASPFLWGGTAITAIGTALLGYAHYLEGGFAGNAVVLHMALGTSLAVLSTVGWLLRARHGTLKRRLETGLAVVLLVLVVLTGHQGGKLTHGSEYLVEFAPGPIRALAGLPPRRPPVTELAEAEIFLDVIQPMLASNCTRCHGAERRRNGLSLADHDAVQRGGETGPVVVPGDPAASELLRRVMLPPDHEDFMPAEGATPLTAVQTGVIAWWIELGAPDQGRLAEFDIRGVETDLRAALGLDGASDPLLPVEIQPIMADPVLVARLSDAGFSVRQVSMQDPRLIVSLSHERDSELIQDRLDVLLAAPDQIVELRLRSSGIDDGMLAAVGELTNLTHLYLDNNAITDAGLTRLENLENLVYLNLVGNAGITDEAAGSLSRLPRLERLFVWNTSMTAGAGELALLRPSLTVDTGVAAP